MINIFSIITTLTETSKTTVESHVTYNELEITFRHPETGRVVRLTFTKEEIENKGFIFWHDIGKNIKQRMGL